ncbi:PIN domain-containing protein [Streptomyces hydrogenans]|uniref:PIN domain-containing protein n=1 Tax=Streptomyces hydrogenans TaxID=1873719 RepID=UPI00345D024A
MLITLDTNLIPRQGKVVNVAIATLLRVAAALNATVAIPRTVLLESVNARRQNMQKAVDQHNAAISNLSKYCTIESYYVPSVDSVVQDWKEELEGAFGILEIDGEDAVEALEREALRKKPAKSDGTGSRDSAIWLCIKRKHLSKGGATHFASNNTDDFATSKRDHSLHPELAEELGNRLSDFHYHTSIDSIIGALCSPVSVTITPDSFAETVRLSIIDQVVGYEDLEKFPDFAGRTPDDFGPVETILFSDIDVRSAYSAAGVAVGFISASIEMPLAAEAHEEIGTSVTGRVGGWFEISEDGGVGKFDVTFLGDLTYVRPWGGQE